MTKKFKLYIVQAEVEFNLIQKTKITTTKSKRVLLLSGVPLALNSENLHELHIETKLKLIKAISDKQKTDISKIELVSHNFIETKFSSEIQHSNYEV